MVDPSPSRTARARRVAHRLGVEFHPDLVDLVPPVSWDDIPTRAEVDTALRIRDEHLARRLQAIRDALAAAQQDEIRRRGARNWAVAGGLTAVALLVRALRRRCRFFGRDRDHGGSSAGQREALHRRRVG
ncbi:MAG TPA: hypothetical protein VLV81_07880 [Acidimicrobiia bacterium]|nr:hypothetical protein [Acidimicrobiia bacterium]